MGFLRKLFGLGGPKKKEPENKYVGLNEPRSDEGKRAISEEARLVYANQSDPLYREKLDCGFLIGEIILLSWLENKRMTADYPEYFEYVYEIDPFKSTRDLMAHGYIKISDPYEALDGLKIPELKEILKAEGLPVSGKKELLISRLRDNLSVEQVGEHVKDKFYTLTEKGKEVADKHGYITFAHSNVSGLYNVADIVRFMQASGLEDVSIEQFNNIRIMHEINESAKQKDYITMRCYFHELATIQKKFKHIDNSIVSFICMFIFDVSGWAGDNNYHGDGISNEYLATLAPSKIGKKIDAVRLEGYFNKAWEMTEQFFPKHYLGKEKTFECLVAGFENDTETIRRLFNLDNRKKRDYNDYG